MSAKPSQLENMLAPVVASLGCELWGLEYRSHGSRPLLRLYVDKSDGVSVEDCERVSRQVSSVLDVENPIIGEYTLEVSSPGLNRSFFRLEQYPGYAGQKLAVRLRMAFENRRNFTGILKGVEGDDIVLEVDDEEYLLPFDLIDKANLVPEF